MQTDTATLSPIIWSVSPKFNVNNPKLIEVAREN